MLKTRKMLHLLLLIFIVQQVLAQNVTGKVISNKEEAIEFVHILLYDAVDSAFITGTMTNENGEFIVKNCPSERLYIKLSCIGYQDTIYFAQSGIYSTYILNEGTVSLNEINVTATRPIVKVDDGKLSFDVPALIQHRPVSNALDVLGEIPGVEKIGERITIIGANSTQVIINNRVSSMSSDQISNYLKNIPPERIKSVELLYTTPPKYGVKGSAINIVLDNDRTKQRENKTQVNVQGTKAHYFSPSAGISFSSANENSLLHVVYSMKYEDEFSGETLEAVHLLNDTTHFVSLKNRAKATSVIHAIGLSFDYDLKNKDRISLSYNTRINNLRSKRDGFIGVDAKQNINSLNKRNGPSDLHNISMSYSHAKLVFGFNYSYYNNRKDQSLYNIADLKSDSIISESAQTVNRGTFYISNEHLVRGKNKISYGINMLAGRSENAQTTFGNNDIHEAFTQRQSEYSADVFMGWSRSFGKKITMNANLALEYYEYNVQIQARQQKLWKKWNLYPTLSMVYKIAPMNTIQLSVLSETRYPTYWQTTPNVTYMNYYMLNEGNPEIMPAKTYSARLNYILKGQYIFQLFGNISSKHIQQLLYQSSEKLQAIYKVINLDRHNTFGFMAVLPFKPNHIVDSKINLSGFLIHDKGRLEEVFFDREKTVARISISNSIFLNAKKNLSILLNGFYTTKGIQGIYDVKPMYNLSSGIVWDINKRFRASVIGDDVLNGRKGKTSTKIQNQNYSQEIDNNYRRIVLTLRYNIGGYKEKKSSGVDISRFGI